MATIKILTIIFFIIFWFIAHISIGFPKYNEKQFEKLTTTYEIKRIKDTTTFKRIPTTTSLKIDNKIFRNYNQYENYFYEPHSILFLINSIVLFIICTKF